MNSTDPSSSDPFRGFSRGELQHYARHFSLEEVGAEDQRKLKEARALLNGAGGLGSPASLYLAAAGVGTLGIIDSDAVELSDYARDRLEARGVEVRTGSPVERVTSEGVVLKGGEEIASETVVWTGGVRGVDGPSAWGLPMDPQGRVRAAQTLQIEGWDDLWVAEDLTWLEQDGELLPGVAPVAIQQGQHVARTLLALAEGKAPEPPIGIIGAARP